MTALVLAGCYSPSVDDCQFRCEPTSRDCPDDMECATSGFCRPKGATGQCRSSSGPCAAAPALPSGCHTAFAADAICVVLCGTDSGGTQKSWGNAILTCENAGWQLAVLDTVGRLDAVPKLNDAHWVGASRTSTWFWRAGGMPAVDPLSWESGTPPLSGAGCAYANKGPARLDNSGVSCDDQERYMCTWPVR